MTEDIAERCWRDPYWLDALAEVDRDPPEGESPVQTYKRRLVAITVMCDIEQKYQEEESRT